MDVKGAVRGGIGVVEGLVEHCVWAGRPICEPRPDGLECPPGTVVVWEVHLIERQYVFTAGASKESDCSRVELELALDEIPPHLI